MTASLEALVVAAYIFADQVAITRPGPEGKITDAELIALAVAQASMGIPSDRQFLGLVGKVLPGWFPHLPPSRSTTAGCGGSRPRSSPSSFGSASCSPRETC